MEALAAETQALTALEAQLRTELRELRARREASETTLSERSAELEKGKRREAELTAGLSRALSVPSEKEIKCVATIMPTVEISWVLMPRGVERLYVNFMYVISMPSNVVRPYSF